LYNIFKDTPKIVKSIQHVNNLEKIFLVFNIYENKKLIRFTIFHLVHNNERFLKTFYHKKYYFVMKDTCYLKKTLNFHIYKNVN
jgi:capsule polysaccharide export protein KpsE/RkpR